MKKLTIGLIGIGDIVDAHLNALKANPEYKLTGICRRSPDKLKVQAEDLGVKGYAVFELGYIPDPSPTVPLPVEKPEWGWKTSPETNVIDDAVVWRPKGVGPPPIWEELAWPVYPWPELFIPPFATDFLYDTFVGHGGSNDSVNMAFELLTDICPRRTTKWSQLPDMITGTDMWSWVRDQESTGSTWLRADDFVSDGRRISDVHWWGSYSNYMMHVPGSETNPIPPPGPANFMRPLGFNLSWHDSKDPDCVPGLELTNVFVTIDECNEMYYGTVGQFWVAPPYTNEHEYQYYVDLLDYDLGPWYEEEGKHYWLNIEAVFHPSFVPSDQGEGEHGGWGWKIAELPPTDDCTAAVSNRLGGPWTNSPPFGGIMPPHPDVGAPYNLAFELTTDEVSTNSPTLPIVITNTVSQTSNTVHVVKSVGTSGAGTQYLQMNTNLLTNVWTDIPGQVKIAPFPPPIVNTWTVTGVTDSNVFYRVNEK